MDGLLLIKYFHEFLARNGFLLQKIGGNLMQLSFIFPEDIKSLGMLPLHDADHLLVNAFRCLRRTIATMSNSSVMP